MTAKRGPRIGPLHAAILCRQELGRCYRAARYGEISTRQLMAYTVCLKAMADMIQMSEVEPRLKLLEAAQSQTAPPPKVINMRRVT